MATSEADELDIEELITAAGDVNHYSAGAYEHEAFQKLCELARIGARLRTPSTPVGEAVGAIRDYFTAISYSFATESDEAKARAALDALEAELAAKEARVAELESLLLAKTKLTSECLRQLREAESQLSARGQVDGELGEALRRLRTWKGGVVMVESFELAFDSVCRAAERWAALRWKEPTEGDGLRLCLGVYYFESDAHLELYQLEPGVSTGYMRLRYAYVLPLDSLPLPPPTESTAREEG